MSTNTGTGTVSITRDGTEMKFFSVSVFFVFRFWAFPFFRLFPYFFRFSAFYGCSYSTGILILLKRLLDKIEIIIRTMA